MSSTPTTPGRPGKEDGASTPTSPQKRKPDEDIVFDNEDGPKPFSSRRLDGPSRPEQSAEVTPTIPAEKSSDSGPGVATTLLPEALDPSYICITVEGANIDRFIRATDMKTAKTVHDHLGPPKSGMRAPHWTLPADEANDDHLMDIYILWTKRKSDNPPDWWYRKALWGSSGKCSKPKARWIGVPSLWFLGTRLGDEEFMESVTRSTIEHGNLSTKSKVPWEFLAPVSKVVVDKLNGNTSQIQNCTLLRVMVEVFVRRASMERKEEAAWKAPPAVAQMMLQWVYRLKKLTIPTAESEVKALDYVGIETAPTREEADEEVPDNVVESVE